MIPFGCSSIITFGLWSSANIKRLTMLICILILIVVVLSIPCLAQTENTSRTKTIVFGGRVNAAPFSFWDGSHWRGYTIELCNKIFDQYKEALGDEDLELEILPVTAANRFMALKENRIQALCGATTVTIRRKRDYNFSLMTYLSGASIMKRRGTKVEKLILAKDQHKKIKVSVVEKTTTKAHVRRLLGASVDMLEEPSHDDAFGALQQGEVDFYFGDRAILRERLRNFSDRDDFILAPGFLSYEPYAIAIQKRNIDLLHAADAALAALYRSGEINKIYQHWFGNSEMSDLLKAMYQIQKIPE